MGAGGGPAAAAQLLAVSTGHVITIGYDATVGLNIGTFGASTHAGDALAFDRQGNIAWISTTGAGGGGFSGDIGLTGQLQYLQATSVLSLESGVAPAFSIAGGAGVQGQLGTDLEGNITLGIGAGEGIATTSNLDVTKVSILACGPG